MKITIPAIHPNLTRFLLYAEGGEGWVEIVFPGRKEKGPSAEPPKVSTFVLSLYSGRIQVTCFPKGDFVLATFDTLNKSHEKSDVFSPDDYSSGLDTFRDWRHELSEPV